MYHLKKHPTKKMNPNLSNKHRILESVTKQHKLEVMR